MKYLITVLTLWVSTIAYGQDTIKHFITFGDERKCKPNDGYYYRVAFKESDWWRVKDYYCNTRSLYRDGVYKHKNEKDSFYSEQGMFFYYHPNKMIMKKVRFINGLKEGLAKEYHRSGGLADSAFYKKGVLYKAHYAWDSAGNIKIKAHLDDEGVGERWEYHTDGKVAGYGKIVTGYKQDSIWTYYHDNGQISSIEQYKDDSLLSIHCFNADGTPSKDSCSPEQMPEPPYDLMAALAENIHYPDFAREHNIDGKVSVEFIVDIDGTIKDVKAIGGPGGGLREESVRVVSLLPPWKPGKSHNRLARVYYTLPVSYRLEY